MAVETVHAVCPHDCYDACGLKVTAEDGRVTAIKGDPNHPITRGFLCFKVNHYRDRLYHPDRVTTPLRRVGAKGSGEFEPVSWEQALAEVGGQLQRIMAEWGGEAVLPYTFAGNEGILSHVMAHRFFTLIGASRLDRTICTAAADAALKWVYGTGLGPDPETLPRARLVLLWGSNPLATNIHAVPLLDEARQNGAVIWTIDPLKTVTARR
ncbi:MAG: molybdopterin-dependent oxidoreductase, partial [Thermaerobacter sp.]|nr:molybdopterin-dependent oxidoreductase [Thermaerobacter sp.]